MYAQMNQRHMLGRRDPGLRLLAPPLVYWNCMSGTEPSPRPRRPDSRQS
jgi:hypothetical protein